MPPPETLKYDVSRDADPLMTVDIEHLKGKEVDELYARLEQRGELFLTRREERRLRQMRELLLLCLVPYSCLLVVYILGWIARWMGVLR